MANTNLANAKTAKNDEFYTQYPDIQKEINAYLDYNPDVFRGKTVLLPCDDPEWSNFTKFFAQNFELLGLKKLISTSFAPESKKFKEGYMPTLFETESPIFDQDKTRTHGKIFVLDHDANNSGRIDIEDLQWHYLEGDGDFRSKEIRKLRDEADIIVTNPPFSLFREFFAWIMEAGKKFVIIGNINAVSYKEIFPYIKNGEVWLGSSYFNGGAAYFIADASMYDPAKMSNPKNAFFQDGKFLWRVNGVRWYTNIDHGRRHEPLKLMTMAENIKHSKHKEVKGQQYVKYDNYDALEVPYYDSIPSDYDGLMGVPRSFLDKYCPDQFEIIGVDSTDFAEELGIAPIGEEWIQKYKAAGGTGHMTANMRNLVLTVDGVPKISYARILIRKKQ